MIECLYLCIVHLLASRISSKAQRTRIMEVTVRCRSSQLVTKALARRVSLGRRYQSIPDYSGLVWFGAPCQQGTGGKGRHTAPDVVSTIVPCMEVGGSSISGAHPANLSGGSPGASDGNHSIPHERPDEVNEDR